MGRIADAGRIELLPTEGDGFGSLATANPPSQSYRQPLITSYKKSQALRFSWSLVDVVHGTLSNGERASLIVTRFSFESGNAARRFKSATINYVFLPEDSFSDGPIIENISPLGEFLMVPPDAPASTDVDGLSASFSKAALIDPALSNLRITRRESFNSMSSSRTIRIPWAFADLADLDDSEIIQGQPTLTGLTRCLGHEGGGDNTARWVLRENTSTKRGIPTVLQTAVLLRRSNDANFIATVDIQAEVDLAHAMSTAFKNIAGLVPRDDPIRFAVDANTGTDNNILNKWDHLDDVKLRDYREVASTKRSGQSVENQGSFYR